MAVRPAPPAFFEPEETVILWSIREFRFSYSEETSCHLVGYIHRKMTMRVTSPIASFNQNSLQVITSSGRAYYLHGNAELNQDIEDWLKIYIKNHNIVSEQNVTHEYVRTH
jgi:hypothetical protein